MAAFEILNSKYADDVGQRAFRNAKIMKDGVMHKKTKKMEKVQL